MTHSDPVVTPNSGVPEVAQEFDALVAEHRARLEAEHGVKLPAEPEQDWYFTFGHGQTHPASGEDLMGAYVVINGTYLGARQQMVDAFGLSWCDQYSSDEKAGVAMFGLRQIELPPPMQVEQAPPVTPAEERTGVSDVQAAVATETAGLREAISRYGAARELFGAAREALDLTARAEAQTLAHRLDADINGRLDRIEQWTRGAS